jgi:hypothetical protein
MNEIITKIEKLAPNIDEAITLFYDMNNDDFDLLDVSELVNKLNEKYPENAIVALPTYTSLGSCDKEFLESYIRMIRVIIDSL